MKLANRAVEAVDARIASGRSTRRTGSARHWSFWLGHIAIASLVVIIMSGVFLTVWFTPSMTPVVYDGAYAPLQGVVVSEAYASALELSFEVRGGLLMRQVHVWATHVFVAAMALHLLRVYFTGGFRTPRKTNWLIGLGLLVLGIVGGYTGHSLLDELLSGTGLRVVEGGILAIPVVGTYLSWLIFGGEYPGDDVISRLHLVHVFVVPVLIAALLVLHLVLVRRHGPTAWIRRKEASTTGTERRFARAGGFMLIVVGVIVVMGMTIQINPVWLQGPYDPSQVTAGSQPHWYVGFLDGGMRLMPPLEIVLFGHELSLSVLVPVIVLPGVMLAALAGYPWIEQMSTADRREWHVLDRPRDMPVRTGLGVAFIVFYLVLWIAGGNDILATTFHLPMNWVTRFLQVGLIVLPPLAYWITMRICFGLQRRDRDTLQHGRESGLTVVSRAGGFSGVRVPLSERDAQAHLPAERPMPFDLGPEMDENGIPAPRSRSAQLRAWLAKVYYSSPDEAGDEKPAEPGGQDDQQRWPAQ